MGDVTNNISASRAIQKMLEKNTPNHVTELQPSLEKQSQSSTQRIGVTPRLEFAAFLL